MIVSETPNETSPLKTGEMSPTTPPANRSAAPPPYSPAAAPAPAPVLSYFSVPVTAPHQYYVQQPEHHPRPFKRFLKAFFVAVIILMLWGAFVDSIDMVAGKPGHRPGHRHGYSQGMGVRWTIHDWYADGERTKNPPSPPVPPPYLDQGAPTSRVLPIQYPPKA